MASNNPAGNAPSGVYHDDKELKSQAPNQPAAGSDRMGTSNTITAELGKKTAQSITNATPSVAGVGKTNASPGDVATKQ